MSKWLLIVLLLAAPARAEWVDALKPTGKAESVELSRPIQIPAKASTAEQKAAEDLAHWIKEMTGTAPQIVKADEGSASTQIATDEKLGPDGYRIEVKDQHLALYGAPGRGVINAVYALLEEDLGCRFYTNESLRVPRLKSAQVSVVPRTYAPKLRLRDPFYFASFDATWSLRNRTNAPDAKVPEEFGGHMDYGPLFVHTHAALLPADKYFKDHPEYFAAKAGTGERHTAQICPTHPDVVKIVIENVRKILKDNPHIEIVSISKNDNQEQCHCATCEKIRSDEGSEMAVQLYLVNKVAEVLENQNPAVLVDTLAYLDTIPVPKTVRPRKNVVIRLCNDTVGAWSRPFTPAREMEVAKIASAWGKVHGKLSVWDYNINFSHFPAPMPNMHIIADNIRFWVENHAIGLLTQGGYQSTSERDQMRSWVIAKLMWDPSLDLDALEKDFIEGHYGPAAPMVLEYEALLKQSAAADARELANPPGGIRYPMTIGFLNKDFLAKSTEIFGRAERAAGNDPALMNRVERAELPILYVKCAQGMAATGPEYPAIVDRFERLARKHKVQWILEQVTQLDGQLAAWRKEIPAAALKPARKPAAAQASYKTISKGPAAHTYQAFPDACRLKNGDILCVFYAGYGHVSLAADDMPNGGRICIVRSSDEGKTWSQPAVLFDDADDNRDSHIAQLDDGSLICTFFSWQNKGERLKSTSDFSWKAFHAQARATGAQMVRSTDNGKTWETTATTISSDWFCSAPVRQLPDGTCLLGLYGDDPADAKKRNIPAIARSRDRGRTWSIAQVPTPKGISLDAETDLIRLKDGKLFAALRSSTKGQNMFYSTSSDDGATWSMAADIGFPGHCPHLNRLSSGAVILCHRLPNTSIHISRDDCKTWQGPFEIDNCIGAYPATVELKDGSVLVVYYSEGAGSEIRAKRFRVKDDGIEMIGW